MTEAIVFGGGCFWCTEAAFQRLRGVESVVPGYAGGHVEKPTYVAVCEGTTGHAEVVKVEFDPEIISLDDLLEVFKLVHDPTSLNQQGADVGTQYRSAIYYTTPEQKQAAENWAKSIPGAVTEIAPLDKFYEAEVSHKDYYNRNREAGYCRVVIDPKIEKLKLQMSDKLKE
jgi:peptide-methionine (S)-S-oxide reductase